MRRMGREQNKWIDDAVKAAFGVSEEQLEAEYDKAAALQTPDTARPEPEGEFERILARAEAQNAVKTADRAGTAAAGEDPAVQDKQGKGEMRGSAKPFLRRWRVAGALASLAVISAVALWPGVKAVADRLYVYRMQAVGEHEVVLNNVENKGRSASLITAYRKIQDELGIRVLELGYIPEGMACESCEVYGQDFARITFFYNEKYAFLCQLTQDVVDSTSYLSDMEKYKQVYNPYFDKDIWIYRNRLEDGQYEYGTLLLEDRFVYYLNVQIEENEFVKMVEGMKYWDN